MNEITSKAEKIRCRVCRNEILFGAKKCTECSSYQSKIYNILHPSIPVLSLLVALSAVLLNGTENLKRLIFGRSAIIIAGISDANSDTTVRVSFSNEGDISARIEKLLCEWVKPTNTSYYNIGVELRPQTNILVAPNATTSDDFFVENHYVRRWIDSEIDPEFGFGEVLLKMSKMVVKPAFACCGEPTARCQVIYNDGGIKDKNGGVFTTTKMSDWHRKMSEKFDQNFERDIKGILHQ